MIIETLRFGELEVNDSGLIELGEGLLGFADSHRYCLIECKPGSPFRWLQSADRQELAFLVIDPYEFFSEYEIVFADEIASELGLERPEDAGVLALVSIQEGRSLTANLAGPVVVNTRTGKGRQLVLDSDRYTTRHQFASIPGEERHLGDRKACVLSAR